MRELEEETGMCAGSLTPLGAIFVSPGFTDEQIWLFAATELTQGKQDLEHDELLSVEYHALHDAILMANNGDITDAKSVCAILRYAATLAA